MWSTLCGRPTYLLGENAYEAIYVHSLQYYMFILEFTSQLVLSYEFTKLDSDYSLAVVVQSQFFTSFCALRELLSLGLVICQSR